MQEYSKGIKIRRLIVWLFQRDFGGHVTRTDRVASHLERAMKCSCTTNTIALIPTVCELTRKSKIKKIDIATNIKTNVVGFQVAINDASVTESTHAFECLSEGNFVMRYRAAG